MIEEAVAGWGDGGVASGRFTVSCGSSTGSDRIFGEGDMPRRLRSGENWSPERDIDANGGEYCVPTSTVVLAGASRSCDVANLC